MKQKTVMMFGNSISRSIFSILLGLALILWPEVALNYIVIMIGLLFFIPGVISMISSFLIKKKSDNNDSEKEISFNGIAGVILGLLLILMPSFFVNIMMYLLGVLLIIAAIGQYMTLRNAAKAWTVSLLSYFMPIVTFLAGLVVFMNPFSTASGLFMFFGIMTIFYGITELISWYKYK